MTWIQKENCDKTFGRCLTLYKMSFWIPEDKAGGEDETGPMVTSTVAGMDHNSTAALGNVSLTPPTTPNVTLASNTTTVESANSDTNDPETR